MNQTDGKIFMRYGKKFHFLATFFLICKVFVNSILAGVCLCGQLCLNETQHEANIKRNTLFLCSVQAASAKTAPWKTAKRLKLPALPFDCLLQKYSMQTSPWRSPALPAHILSLHVLNRYLPADPFRRRRSTCNTFPFFVNLLTPPVCRGISQAKERLEFSSSI